MQKVKRLMFARLILLATSLGFIALGVSKHEPVIVLQKAVKICLECIGIG